LNKTAIKASEKHVILWDWHAGSQQHLNTSHLSYGIATQARNDTTASQILALTILMVIKA
jgi:hypothetical protein